jgi:hypothetical protein
MGFLVAILALTLAAVIGALAYWYFQQSPKPPSAEPDLAGPYREGLHAAMRMQTVAQDLEQQMYAEAIRRANKGSGG